MNINKIKEIISDTNFHFEKVHCFDYINDRYKDNHNVLVNGKYRIVAKNNRRDLWRVYKIENNGLSLLSKCMPLSECLAFCKLKEVADMAIKGGK